MSDVIGTNLTIGDINTEIDAEPRIGDLRLAEALGFNRPRDIRDLIERHRPSLEKFGVVSRHRAAKPPPGSRGGRPEELLYLNRRQALFICTKAETERATEATIQMVEVFDAYLRGTAMRPLVTTDLSPEQLQSLNKRAEQLMAPVIVPIREEMRRRVLERINLELGRGRFPYISKLDVEPPKVAMSDIPADASTEELRQIGAQK